MCVQRFDDSQCSAIHITFRALLRSSSIREPRDPLLKVFNFLFFFRHKLNSIDSTPGGAEAHLTSAGLWMKGPKGSIFLMIPPQVHLRRPCYDFYFL